MTHMAFLTGKALPRRTVLRGLGATVALPLLDAMFPASVFSRTAPKRIHRFQAVYVPNGMAMEYWTPKGEGRDFEISPIMEPLAPFRDQMLVLSGLDREKFAVHAGASGSFLTGAPRGGDNETDLLADVSVDQLIARELGKETQLPSLEVSMDPAKDAGSCEAGYSCAYQYTISWRTPTQPLPMEYNPRLVFERLFGDSGSTERAVRVARLRQKQSILDFVTGQLADLKREIGPEDRIKIEEYTEAVRSVEHRIQLAEERSDIELPVLEQPRGIPRAFEDHAELMFDLQLLALRTDLTRVVTFMMGPEQSARPYPQIGVPEGHHPLSHHGNVPALITQMSKINRYHVELFSQYLAKLRATPDGDGSLLDNMTILYGSGMSNSTAHAAENLPLMLVGGGAGGLTGGRHLKYSDGPTNHANLLVTLADKLGVPVDRVGRSTGKLPIDTLAEV